MEVLLKLPEAEILLVLNFFKFVVNFFISRNF